MFKWHNDVIRLIGFTVLLVLALLRTGSALAQTEAAEDELSPFRIGVPVGAAKAASGRWSTLAADIENPNNQDAKVLVRTQVDDDLVQYGREVWLPANSKRLTWYPVHIEGRPANGKYYRLSSYFFDRTLKSQRIVKSREESQKHFSRFPFLRGSVHLSVITDLEPLDEKRIEWSFTEPLPEHVAVRLGVGLQRNLASKPSMSIIADEQLPTTDLSFSAVDGIIIASDRVADDPATIIALRHWVQQGGHMMILLGFTSPDVVAQLTEDVIPHQIVGTTQLSEVEIFPAEAGNSYGKRTYDDSVQLIQLVVDESTVTHEVEGWPVIAFQQVGRGQIWLNALGSEGWLWTTANEREANGDVIRPGMASDEWIEIGQNFMGKPAEPLIQAEALSEPVRELIGKEILRRQWIILVLGGLTLALLITGLVLSARRQLERMLYIGPIAALSVALGLTIVGEISRKAIEPTLAIGQIVQVQRGSNSVQMDGTISVYNQIRNDTGVGGRGGGEFFPEVTAGTTVSMVFSDYQSWNWEEHTFAAGAVADFPFHHTASLANTPTASGAYTANGLEGTISAAPFTRLEQAVIATQGLGNMQMRLLEQGQFQVGTDDVLPRGVYSATAFVSVAQRRRQGLLNQIFEPEEAEPFPKETTVLVWAAPNTMQFQFPEQKKIVGEALLVIPLEIERTPPDTEFLIPGALMAYRSVTGPGGRNAPSSSFNQRSGWLPQTHPNGTWIGLEIPPQVLPMQILSATIIMDVDAPEREMSIYGLLPDEQPRLLYQRTSPFGRLQFPIEDSQVFTLRDGRLVLGIDVAKNSTTPWEIKTLHVNLRGRTLPSTAR